MRKKRNLFNRANVFFLAFLVVFALASQSAVADTTFGDTNSVIVWADTDNSGRGTLTLKVGANHDILIADAQGVTTLDLGYGAITYAGAVSGVTTLSTLGATTLGSTLSVSGATTISSSLTVTGLTTLNGIDNSNGGIINTGAISGATTIDASGTITGGNLVSNGTLNVVGATTLGSTLAVTGTTTLTGALTANGGATIHNGSAIFSGNGIGNSMIVDATSSRLVSADGASSVEVSNGFVDLEASIPDSSVWADLDMFPNEVSLVVNNPSTDEWHGIVISQTSTVISGGTTSTSLTLDDSGARFANDTGGPVRVTGVANGVSDFDAVNMRQYRRLEDNVDESFSGIASVAALAAIPSPVAGKNVSLGVGFGNFENQNAIAVGGKVLLGSEKNITLSAGLGYCDSSATLNAGLGWSF